MTTPNPADPKPGRAPPGRRAASGRRLNRVIAALTDPDLCGCEIAHDDFHDRLVIRRSGGGWRHLTMGDVVELRMRLAQVALAWPISGTLMRDALLAVGRERRFDSAYDWLTALEPWDGKSRVEDFCARYLGAVDTVWAGAVASFAWTAHVARVLESGSKTDRLPVLVGAEGVGKSMAVQAIAPSLALYADFDPRRLDDAAMGRRMRGSLVGEVTTMQWLHARNRERLLERIIRSADAWRPKYQAHKISRPRRALLWGTTANDEVLQASGERHHFLPIAVGSRLDVDAIKRDRLQLWAEARDLFMRHGVVYQVVERQLAEEGEPWLR